jgi:hypothetical protein
MNNPIDINFNVLSDTPPSKDPDSHSPTLRKYHKILWSKPLPNGKFFKLVDSNPKTYLYHKSCLGEFELGSDAITHSYRNWKRMSHIIKQIPTEKVESLFDYGCTIGSYIVFPKNRINKQNNINQARCCSSKIADRFDLTLECIRLFYKNIENPLTSDLQRYTDFFSLFSDFKGYVDFFLLQDLITTDYSAVKYHLQHQSFEDSPLPQSPNEYIEYRENTLTFIKARSKRMVNSVGVSTC